MRLVEDGVDEGWEQFAVCGCFVVDLAEEVHEWGDRTLVDLGENVFDQRKWDCVQGVEDLGYCPIGDL